MILNGVAPACFRISDTALSRRSNRPCKSAIAYVRLMNPRRYLLTIALLKLNRGRRAVALPPRAGEQSCRSINQDNGHIEDRRLRFRDHCNYRNGQLLHGGWIPSNNLLLNNNTNQLFPSPSTIALQAG